MSAQQPMDPNHPIMLAWEELKNDPEYDNVKRWAKHEEHVDGSLWWAFLKGATMRREDVTKGDVFHHVEGMKRDEWPTQSAIDERLHSLSKAWPYLTQHAPHLDGEFNNAHVDLRGMISSLKKQRDRAVDALLKIYDLI